MIEAQSATDKTTLVTVKSYPTFTLSRLFLAIAGVALLLGLVRLSISVIENSSEQQIADYIRELGGAYHPDRQNGRHISGVWLQDTDTTDRDLEVVLRLPYLKALDLANTRVTDASLDRIFDHQRVVTLRVVGSAISEDALSAALSRPENHVYLDE